MIKIMIMMKRDNEDDRDSNDKDKKCDEKR